MPSSRGSQVGSDAARRTAKNERFLVRSRPRAAMMTVLLSLSELCFGREVCFSIDALSFGDGCCAIVNGNANWTEAATADAWGILWLKGSFFSFRRFVETDELIADDLIDAEAR